MFDAAKILEWCAGLGQKFSKSYFSCLSCFEAFAVAVCHEAFEGVALITIEDAIDGIVARDILDLASAEFVFLSQSLGVIL